MVLKDEHDKKKNTNVINQNLFSKNGMPRTQLSPKMNLTKKMSFRNKKKQSTKKRQTHKVSLLLHKKYSGSKRQQRSRRFLSRFLKGGGLTPEQKKKKQLELIQGKVKEITTKKITIPKGAKLYQYLVETYMRKQAVQIMPGLFPIFMRTTNVSYYRYLFDDNRDVHQKLIQMLPLHPSNLGTSIKSCVLDLNTKENTNDGMTFDAYSVATKTKWGFSAKEISDAIMSVPYAFIDLLVAVVDSSRTNYNKICEKMIDDEKDDEKEKDEDDDEKPKEENMVSELLNGTAICFFKI